MSSFSFFINFKTYPQATGRKAVELALAIDKVAEQKKLSVVILPQATDLAMISQKVGYVSCWSQHVDEKRPGPATGWLTLESLISCGAKGSLLNHSEHRLPPGTVKQTISRAKDVDKTFKTMVCGQTLGQLKKMVHLKPDFLAFEIKELIGTKNSITQTQPSLIKKALLIAKNKKIPLVVGAGINSREDILLAGKMGTRGVLISSAIILANNPKQKFEELSSSF